MAKRPSPGPARIWRAMVSSRGGQTVKVELTVKLVVPREVAERLARGIREGRKLEALVEDLLADAAQ